MANNTDWLNISQMTGGTGETALSLTALTNTSLKPKTATITARNTQYNVSDTTTVTIQGFQPTLTLSRSTLRFDSTGGTATFTVYSNTAWTITFPAIVQSYSTSAGTGDTEVSVVLAPNPDEVAKVDTGIVKDVYNVNQLYLTIVQESFIAELYVEPTDDIIFANTGSSTAITIETNADWELEYPSWVVPSVTSGESGTTTVTLTAGQNGPTDRSGQVIVYAGSKYVTINVSQPFYIEPYLTVNPSALTFSYNADVSTVMVNSYPGWSAEVFSTGETHWGEDIALTVELEVGSDNVTVSDLGQAGCIVNGVVVPGRTCTFKTKGTYTVLYPFTGETLSGMGTIPNYDSITATSIVIGENITTIHTNCFSGEKITAITIPSGITSIGGGAFSCPNLTTIYAEPVVAPSVTNTTFRGIAKNGTLHYPKGSDYSSWLNTDEYYLGYNFWNGLMPSDMEWLYTVTYDVTSTTADTKILRSSYYVTGIRDRATGQVIYMNTGHSSAANITYMFSQTGKQDLDFLIWSASTSAFLDLRESEATDLVVKGQGENECDVTTDGNKLTGLTINGGAIYCLYGSGNGKYYAITPSIKKLVYGPNATKLNKSNTLTGCSWLHYVDMSQTSFVLPEKLFKNCTGLTTALLPNNVTVLPASAFQDCNSLVTVQLPEGLTTIWNDVFAGCTALETITIPSTVTDMTKSKYSNYYQVFNNNTSLKTIFALPEVPPKTSGGTWPTFGGGIATGGTVFSPNPSAYRNNWEFDDLISSGWTFVVLKDDMVVVPSSIEIAKNGGNISFTVASSEPWTASTNAHWITLLAESGASGNTVVNATIDYYDAVSDLNDNRQGTITVTIGAKTSAVTITQRSCLPLVLASNLGNTNNQGKSNGSDWYLFDSGITEINPCDYDFRGIKSICHRTDGSFYRVKPVASLGVIGDRGCLETIQNISADCSTVQTINYPFGNDATSKAAQSLTSCTFFNTDNVTYLGNFVPWCQNIRRLKLGNMRKCSNATNVFSTNNVSITEFEIDAFPNRSIEWGFEYLTNLTVHSLVNILTALPETSSSNTITIGSTNKNKLSEAQLQIATDKGWTVK